MSQNILKHSAKGPGFEVRHLSFKFKFHQLQAEWAWANLRACFLTCEKYTPCGACEDWKWEWLDFEWLTKLGKILSDLKDLREPLAEKGLLRGGQTDAVTISSSSLNSRSLEGTLWENLGGEFVGIKDAEGRVRVVLSYLSQVRSTRKNDLARLGVSKRRGDPHFTPCTAGRVWLERVLGRPS